MVKISNKDVLNVHSVKKVIFNNMLDLEQCSVLSGRQSLWFICRHVVVADVPHNEVSDLIGTYLLQNLRYTHLKHTNTLHRQTGHWSVCLPVCLTFHLSEHFLENSAKLTDCSGFFFRCSSLHVWTKKAYADVFPFGLLTSLRIIVAACQTDGMKTAEDGLILI